MAKSQLTPREVKFVKNLVKTGNMTKAAIASGSPVANAAQCGWAMMRRVRSKMSEVLMNHGITPDSVVEKVLVPGLNAMRTEFFAHQGVIIETKDVVDHEQRGKYADRIFKLTGLYVGQHDQVGEQRQAPNITINLGFLEPGEAREVLERAAQRLGLGDSRQLDVDAGVDEHEGRPGPEKAV